MRSFLIAATLLVANGCSSTPEQRACYEPGVSGAAWGVEESFPGLRFDLPVAAAIHPQAPDRWFVVEQAGRVVTFDAADPGLVKTVALDITDKVEGPELFWELGLLGLALHPDFASDKRAWLYYTTPSSSADSGVKVVLSEIRVEEDFTFDRVSETPLLELDQRDLFHQAGTLTFTPDGYLLASIGDGGDETQGQNLRTPLGTLIRIDVNTPGTYRPAPDNPFIDEPLVDSSIYAYGFRNPWKLSVDRGTGVIWAADVGGDEREEVNRVEAGGNYGWPIYEGTVARQNSLTSTLCNGCETLGPVTELCHPTVGAVTGGYVYRGSAFPELAGRYIFADFLTGLLFGIPADTTSFAEAEVLGENAFGLSSFVEDANGELFALGLITGTVQRLGPVAELPEPAPVLTTSGLVDPDDPTQPPSTALPYDVRWTFFSDDATKRRWVILPEDTSMVELEDGAVEVPVGSVVVKHFELDGRPIETRALRLLEPEVWQGVSYEWNDEGTDAELLSSSKLRDFDGKPWYYPSRGDCFRCHTDIENVSLGLHRRQLENSVDDQWQEWIDRGVLIPAENAATETLPTPEDPTASLDEQVRAYLETNCAFCHQPGGTGGGNIDLRFDTPLAERGICDERPRTTDLGIEDARIVAAGAPDRSTLMARVDVVGGRQMNPLRLTIDEDGVDLIRRWIETLRCP